MATFISQAFPHFNMKNKWTVDDFSSNKLYMLNCLYEKPNSMDKLITLSGSQRVGVAADDVNSSAT
uniref:START domain-containing protein n=1 Tax=Syphacia muris TaxID=451379 RepID=A0A0N5AEA0_9BILA